MDLGLVERVGRRGRYRAARDWERVLERERRISGEARAERLDEAEAQRRREAYELYRAEKERHAKAREEKS